MKDKLFALYDGELDQASRWEVEAHMEGCQECRELHQRWTQTSKILFKASKPASSEFFVRSVMNRIHELETPKPAFRWNITIPWLIPAAGLLLMILTIMPVAPEAMTMDAFLMQQTSGHLSWALSHTAPSADDTLQFVMEG